MAAPAESSVVNYDETVVRSSCPECGTVDVPAESVTVLVSARFDAPGGADPVYRYTCPGCVSEIEKPTSAKAVPLLRGAGARIVVVPAEVIERWAVAAPALDAADLLELARALEGTDDLAALAAAPPLRRPTTTG